MEILRLVGYLYGIFVGLIPIGPVFKFPEGVGAKASKGTSMTKTELAQQVEDLMDSYHDGVMPTSEFEIKLHLIAINYAELFDFEQLSNEEVL